MFPAQAPNYLMHTLSNFQNQILVNCEFNLTSATHFKVRYGAIFCSIPCSNHISLIKNLLTSEGTDFQHQCFQSQAPLFISPNAYTASKVTYII